MVNIENDVLFITAIIVLTLWLEERDMRRVAFSVRIPNFGPVIRILFRDLI